MFSWEFPAFWNETEEVFPSLSVQTLDASPLSSLSWELPEQLDGPVLWELDFGIDALTTPLSDPQQFKTLALACEHFMEKVWSHYGAQSAGCVLYRGDLDFTGRLVESEELESNWISWQRERGSDDKALYLRDVVAEFLGLLAQHLPQVPAFALVDMEGKSRLQQAQLLDRTCWSGIHPIPRGQIGWEPLIWDRDKDNQVISRSLDEAPAFAVCLPAALRYGAAYQHAVSEIKQSFRWVPEEYLVHEWHGIDQLLVDKTAMGSGTPRMLEGFAAAGGSSILA